MRCRTLATALLALMAFPAAASITGTVMNADGQAIGGAKIALVAPETVAARRARYLSDEPARKALATAATDSKGSFSVDAPKDQPYVDLTVAAPGYAPAEMWLQADEEAGAIVLTSAPARTGTVKANGKAVANATVIWLSPIPVPAEVVTKTDANGHYSVPDPSKWASRAIVFHPDYATFEEDARVGGNRGRGRNAQRDLSDTDLTLNSGVALRGRVTADDGSAAANADVLLDHWPLAKTGADGTFVVAHAPKNWKAVEAYAGGRSALRANGATLALKLAKSAAADGRLIDAKSQAPVAGAQVYVTSNDMFGSQIIASAITDVKGNYSIAPLLPGAYALRVLRPGYGVQVQNITVTAGQSVHKSLFATPHARLIGTVVDEAKHPVAAAHVTTAPAGRGGGFNPMMMMARAGTPVSAWSGPDGRFVARDVAADDTAFIVSATKKGFPPATTSAMKAAAGETKSGITLVIPRGVAFAGKVVDKDGKPVADAEVDAVEASGNPMGLMRVMIGGGRRGRADESVRTAADGTFSMRVKEAAYDFLFRHDGFAAKTLRGEHVTSATKPVVVTLEPGVEITGRVTRGGMPVEGVNIAAIAQSGVQLTATATDGSFRLGDLTPGQMMLNASKADSFIQENRPVTAPAQNVNFDLPAGGRVMGHVIDKSSGKPISTFTAGVSVSRSGGGMVIAMPPQMRQFTADDGTFALDGVRPGPIELVVSSPGYTTSHTTNIEVEDGKATRDIEVSLDTGVKLSGRVTDSNGQPVAGVSVQPAQGGGTRTMRIDPTNNGTATDANGEYTLDAQESGEKTYSFSRSGYVGEERTVTLSGKEFRLDVQLSSGLHVAGQVLTDSGTPIADVSVHAQSAADGTFGRQMQTDANGAFAFDGLAPGHYTFTATKSGVGTAMLRDVDVTVVNPVRITMTAGATITGHVTGLTPDELQNTTVSAVGSGTGNMQVPVDSGGNFRFDGAPTGTVRVSARSGAMFAGGKTSDPKTVVVDPGGSAQVDIEFKSTTVVQGHVTRNGAPMASAMVSFRSTSAQSSASTTADSSGAYQVSGLDDGPYSVQVIDFDHLTPFSTTYTVKGSGNFDIDIKTVSLHGRVLDSTNSQPLADVHVELRPSSADTVMSVRATTSDASGQFTLDDVARGTYQVTAQKEGYGQDVKPLAVSDTPPDDLQFSLAPSDGITLNVVDGRDGRLISAGARAVDSQGHTYDAGDSFRLPGNGTPAPIKIALGPGTYRVTINAVGYAQKTINVTSPSSQTVPMTPGGSLLIHSKSTTPLFGRLIDANGLPYGPPQFTIVASPGVTTLQTVAAGTYRLDVLDANGQVVGSQSVTVNEGQPTEISI